MCVIYHTCIARIFFKNGVVKPPHQTAGYIHSAATKKLGVGKWNTHQREEISPSGVDRFAGPRLEEKIGTPKPNGRGSQADSGSSIRDSWRTTTTMPESLTWKRRRSASRS